MEVRVEPIDVGDEAGILSRLASEGMEEAAGPITESGKPRMLKLTGWMAHDGPANLNKDAFLGEDLKEVAAENLFAPPYLGMVDFNHDFFPYGAWYSARYEFDPLANQYGLLAEGTMFAWRFTEMADKILAEQSRNGYIPVSMACIAQWIEPREGPDGSRESVLRKPVFLAVSILDVPPADPNARAVGDEKEDSSSESRVLDLNKALLQVQGANFDSWVTMAQSRFGKSDLKTNIQEDKMDFDKLLNQLTEALDGKASELVAALKAEIADSAALTARVAELEEANGTLEATNSEIQAALTKAQSDLEASQLALEAKVVELQNVSENFESAKAELDTLKSDVETSRKVVIREERLEQLPEIYIQVLDTREEEAKERAIARLVEMSDEEFADELELLTASSSTSYTDRSRSEGVLPGGKGKRGGLAIDQFIS